MGLCPRNPLTMSLVKRSGNRESNSNSRSGWMFLLPSLALLALFGLPILAIFWKFVGGSFFSSAIAPSTLSALRLSLLTSSLSTLLAVAGGVPLAYILARWDFKGKSTLELLVDLPVVLPPSVAGLALLIAFGRQGIFGELLVLLGISLPFTTTAVVLAQTFVAAPLFVRSARVGFAEIEPQLEEAAIIQGAGEMQLFRFIMIPLAWRSLLTGTILTWARALGEFGATIMFAGNLEGVTQTMPLAIYLGLERNVGVALTLSVMLVLVSVVLLGVLRKLDRMSTHKK
jgi:molybdate transport system permease protein